MSENETHTELLFSYGTLRLEEVQLSLFGRRLAGTNDSLSGFSIEALEIEDAEVRRISGKDVHTMAVFSGKESDKISGIAFEVTSDEIVLADDYEVEAVKRVSVILDSGRSAWVYIDARSARGFGSSRFSGSEGL